MILSEWLGGVRQHVQEDTCGWVACVSVCDSMNTLYLLAEETEIVSTSVKVLRLCVNTLQHSLNVSLEEHIRRILRARLNGKARLVCKGWHDERKRHWCSSVSFLFVSIRRLLTSRKSAIRVLSVSKPELPISVSEQIDNSFQWSVLLSTIALCLLLSCKSVFGQFTTWS